MPRQPRSRRRDSLPREFLRAGSLCEVSIVKVERRTRRARSAAKPFEQYLDKRSGAVQWRRRFTKTKGMGEKRQFHTLAARWRRVDLNLESVFCDSR
jgi:hypothetical protein